MKRVDPLFAYLSILSVIQPARVQDVERSAKDFLGAELSDWLAERDLLREAHENARAAELVVAVRRGVYFLAPKAKLIVRRAGLERSIDNRRLFLMKAQRKRYK